MDRCLLATAATGTGSEWTIVTLKSTAMHASLVVLLVGVAGVPMALPEALIASGAARLAAILCLVSGALTAAKNRAAMIAYGAALVVVWPSIAAHGRSVMQEPTGNCSGCFEIGLLAKGMIAVLMACGVGASLLPLALLFWYFKRNERVARMSKPR